MPPKSLIIGVDLSPIKPIPKAITFQDDITSDRCRATIRGHLKGWKADTVIHDGAPNVGTAWVQDAFSQNELVLSSLKLATDFLAPNGTFVTKVFRSKDSAKLEWIFKQLFSRVEQTKPPSSRNVSAETFYVCRGFKAPKHLDARFLDPKHAFAEVESIAVNSEARVFNPEKKKRKREGYEEGDWTQFHEASASEFIQTQDPIEMLGSLNKIHFRQAATGDIALAALDRLPETTQEVRDCCADLKVLGRKEFKILLRWRLKAREIFGLRQKKLPPGAEVESSAKSGSGASGTDQEGAVGEEVAMVEPMDEEMRLKEELQHMKDMQDKVKRKQRRKENEKKQKDVFRMQMNMTVPSEIGIEAGGPEGTFRLKDVDKSSDIRRQITRGRMTATSDPEGQVEEEVEEIDPDDDEDGDELERQLDTWYETFQEQREMRDSKARAKRARREAGMEHDEEFEGFGSDDKGAETDASSDGELLEDDDGAGSENEDEDGNLMTELKPKNTSKDGLSGRAATFFQQDIFQDMGLDEEVDSEDDKERDSGVDLQSGSSISPTLDADKDVDVDSDDDDAAVAPDDDDEEDADDDIVTEPQRTADSDDDWEERPAHRKGETEGRPNIDIITAEAMTLAHSLATGKTTKHQLDDDNFNKFSHRDVDGLPEWFLDDEHQHSKPQRPITKEAAAAIQQKMRALNARPIKKVREAKARKVLRTARRLEKLKRKSEGLVEDADVSERDKASNIAKLMARAKKGNKKHVPVKLIKAGGANKGAGRPRGVKGKYKMVDARLKKDTRAEKRLAKKTKGKRR